MTDYAVPSSQLGPYQLLRRLGSGGMGVVYLGQHESTGQAAAVKVIRPEYAADPEFRARLRNEVAAAQRVPRSCTAPVLHANLDAAPAWVATEYIDGPSLDLALVERSQLTGATLEAFAVGVAVALRAIHQHQVVHRDLKPSNILLSPVGPRVIDFGIARVEGHSLASQATRLTQTGVVVGTPAYMAPEQLRGERVTAAVDVFAWAGLVTFAATGRTPFGSGPSAMHAILYQEPDLGDLPEQLRGLVAAAFDKDPARRPTAAQLVDRLLEAAPKVTTRVLSTAATAPAVPPSDLESDGSAPAGVPATAEPADVPATAESAGVPTDVRSTIIESPGPVPYLDPGPDLDPGPEFESAAAESSRWGRGAGVTIATAIGPVITPAAGAVFAFLLVNRGYNGVYPLRYLLPDGASRIGDAWWQDSPLWMMGSAVVAFLALVPGAVLFYGNGDRPDQLRRTLAMSLAAAGLVSGAWLLFGFSAGMGMTREHFALTLFTMVSVIATVGLLGCVVANRVELRKWLVFTGIWATLVGFPAGYWIWGEGELAANIPLIRGASVVPVHLAGGAGALALLLWLRRRDGPLAHRGPGRLRVLAGLVLLWVGWSMVLVGWSLAGWSLDGRQWSGVQAWIGWTLLKAQLAMVAGLVAAMLVERNRTGVRTLAGAASGGLAGLVGFTPASGYLALWEVVLLGGVAGGACAWLLTLRRVARLGNPVRIVAVHLVGGVVAVPLLLWRYVSASGELVMPVVVGAVPVAVSGFAVAWLLARLVLDRGALPADVD